VAGVFEQALSERLDREWGKRLDRALPWRGGLLGGDRNRSPIVTVPTPRGRVDVMHQEMRGLRKGSGWRTFWLARRAGKQGWAQADTPPEAIRKATLLPPKKAVAWLDQAAADARKQLEETDLAGSGADSDEVR
jgi:hypothetical protein